MCGSLAILGSTAFFSGTMRTEPSLFAAARDRDLPLAHRMRPKTLDTFLGQEHLIGSGKPLRDCDRRGAIVI